MMHFTIRNLPLPLVHIYREEIQAGAGNGNLDAGREQRNNRRQRAA
jgi:hypothetical protein